MIMKMTEDISFNKKSAKAGEVVTVRVTASSETKLDALSSTPKVDFVTVKEGEEYSFVMPNENVAIKARFTNAKALKKVGVVNHQSNKPKTNVKKQRKFPISPTAIFIFLMLFYPILQFCIMWFGVNINSILLTFKDNSLNYLPSGELFRNYKYVILDLIEDPSILKMYINSLVYLILNCFITLPISLFFAYFIFKKIYAGGVFKTIFYLPSVLPTIILTLVFQSLFNTKGLLEPVFNLVGLKTANFFLDDSVKWMVWIFCFWTGIGYDVMLLTAGMARIPRDLLESAKMDGVSPLKEFFHIIIPLTWPTITTLFIFGMMGVFGTYLQPLLLSGGKNDDTMTIGLKIFLESKNTAKNQPATLGMMCTLVATPIVLGIRSLLNHFFKEVNF